ncbi:McrB family protein [Planktothrix agardhii]|uniref:5-methylcytosine-specific restriction enzyme B n=1 Tax=Planktothrix agardhii TaxID=1160 RepID=A0AAD1Q1Z8_PLAAG|nr:AAA family ATPase [Planktothrix agardhii]CAD5937513.1 5-methylcytosine-specific restriction enzyme B [Planktothrix agardhii]
MEIDNLGKESIIEFGLQKIPKIHEHIYCELIDIYFNWFEDISFDYINFKFDLDLFRTPRNYVSNIVDIEYETSYFDFRILDWLKTNWTKLVQSRFYHFIDHCEIKIDLVVFVFVYFKKIYDFDFDINLYIFEQVYIRLFQELDIEIYSLVELIDLKLGINEIDPGKDYEDNQLLDIINNHIVDLIILQNRKISECLELIFGGKHYLDKSIEETLKIEIDHSFLENEFDYFERENTEFAQQEIKIKQILDNWEEVEVDESLLAARKLAYYFDGQIIDLLEYNDKNYFIGDQKNMQSKNFTAFSYDSVLPKYLFSSQTFEIIEQLSMKYNQGLSSFLSFTQNNNEKIEEFIEQPFNQLCCAVFNKLPRIITSRYTQPKWYQAELKQALGVDNILYIKINQNSLSFGVDKNKQRDLLFNNLIKRETSWELGNCVDLESLFSLSHHEIVISKNDLINYSTNKIISLIEEKFRNHHNLIKSDLLIKYELREFSEETGIDETELQRWVNNINRKGQIILQGPPGTGKTFIAKKLAKHFTRGKDGFSEIIQFHPSYSYEDFIQGIRPRTENGQLTYDLVPGQFLEFCKKAEAYDDICVLIIDEINRANLSNVFGELMYLLEYRDQEINLAGSHEPFKIPENVRIIGTMNTADRSIALVDHALRRRFSFVKIPPNYTILKRYHENKEINFSIYQLIQVIQEINKMINDPNYEIGISFFMIPNIKDNIQDIWEMEIEPYLEEYFYNAPDKIKQFRWYKVEVKLDFDLLNEDEDAYDDF